MIEDKQRLKISLQNLRRMINVNKNDWVNMTSTNCYAYALGLDVPNYEIIDYAYVPGVISNSSIFLPSYRYFTYNMLLNNIYSDFDYLGIEVREINPLEKVNDEEWKIALFTVGQHSCLSDYHFLRFNKKDNIWYHKNGYRGNVFNCDSVGDVITNPQECCFTNRIYDKSFALKLKK